MSKKKILLLSDDLRSHSGIATMSRRFVMGTMDKFDWVQIAAAVKHHEHGTRMDFSDAAREESGVDDASLVLYPNTGYGNAELLRRILDIEKPDAILHFTDPRFWDWLYLMEHELHHERGIPIAYYAIWDNFPYPFWNRSAYESCDLIMGISKQSHLIHEVVLNHFDVDTVDISEPVDDYTNKVMLRYVPHGIDSDQYRPITKGDRDWKEYHEFKQQFEEIHNPNFVVFWNNRNIRRKSPADLIHAFKLFVNNLPKTQRDSVVLIMHTSPQDSVGTDLIAVKRAIAPDCKILFSVDKLEPKQLNFYYNLADVTVNIASNEGFGLSSAESIMAGTMVINNVTGGLQDQMRFRDSDGKWFTPNREVTSNHTGKYYECGEWAIPVFPSSRSIQGSLATPYIMDDRVSAEDVSIKLMEVYKIPKSERTARGLVGREWMMTEECGMNSKEMSRRISESMLTMIENWNTRSEVQLLRGESVREITDNGITA